MNIAALSEASSVDFEPPDILFWRVVGDVSEAEMLRLCAAARALSLGKQYVLSLVDLSLTGAVSAGARKAMIDEKPVAPLFGAAIFGAGFTIRVIAQLVGRAAEILFKPQESPLRFFTTEALARAWLMERREVALLATRD